MSSVSDFPVRKMTGISRHFVDSLIRFLEPSSVPQATVLVYGTRLSAFHAAWVNGAMARAHERRTRRFDLETAEESLMHLLQIEDLLQERDEALLRVGTAGFDPGFFARLDSSGIDQERKHAERRMRAG